MKNMMLTLGVFSILAGTAAAKDGPAPGDRVEITFPSGGTITGTIVAPPPTAPAGSLTLDVSWEYPGLNGTVTVPRQDLKGIRQLQALDEATKRKLAELKKRPAESSAKPAVPKPAARAPEPPKAEPQVDDKAAEELKKAREFYERFPAPDWSPERLNAIRLKRYRGVVPTPGEREFEQGFELWQKGRDAAATTK
jgi:hypothetical protein